MPTSILLNNNNRPQIPNVPQQAPPKPASSFSAGPPSSAAGATHANLSTAAAAASHTQNHTPQAARPQQAQTQTNSFTAQPSKPVTTAPQVQASTSSHSNTHAQSKIEQHSKPAAAPAPAPAPSPAKTPAAASAAIASAPTRPHLHGNPSQMDTQYVNMLLALDDIPALHNIAAQFFTWILLAGFILFPGTFTNLQNDNGTLPDSVRQELLKVVNNLPLFVVAWICTGVGITGMIWLWWRWRKNYIWVLNKIFVPGFLNSLAGLLSTIASILGAQHGDLSTNSKSTLIVTAASTGVLGILAGFYSLWLVRRVKARHDREVGKERAGKHGEGVVDLSKRRAK
ncbi:hypothetical protein CPC08DRAFT_635053 [Agrocybe pediades]|nr:hypothetical protein CPC08DRAFT_635053 [Agrocybe pediades]